METKKITKKCPRCRQELYLFKDSAGKKWEGHQYSFSHMMGDKPMCDYQKNLGMVIVE